jgi:hypothetical protein
MAAMKVAPMKKMKALITKKTKQLKVMKKKTETLKAMKKKTKPLKAKNKKTKPLKKPAGVVDDVVEDSPDPWGLLQIFQRDLCRRYCFKDELNIRRWSGNEWTKYCNKCLT